VPRASIIWLTRAVNVVRPAALRLHIDRARFAKGRALRKHAGSLHVCPIDKGDQDTAGDEEHPLRHNAPNEGQGIADNGIGSRREAGGDGVLVGRVEQEQVADFGTDRPAPFQCDATAFGGNAGGWYRPEN